MRFAAPFQYGSRIALALCLTAFPAFAQKPELPLAATERRALIESPVVAEGILEALDTSPKVRVLVNFAVAGARRGVRGRPRGLRASRAQIAASGDSVLARVPPREFELRHRLQSVNGFSGFVSPRGLLRLASDPDVLAIGLDEGGRGQLGQAVPLSNLDVLHSIPYTGLGVTVAVIDSGLDTDHPDLADDLDEERCYCSDNGNGCCPLGGTFESGPGSAEDDHGHGTNVTGIVTSAGGVAGLGGAPDAEIVSIKVLDDNNMFCCGSDVLAAVDWIFSSRPDVDLVNLSLGTFALHPGECDAVDPFTGLMGALVAALRMNGTLVFASAGNEGSGTEMTAPACVPGVISVGAVFDSDIGSFSGLGCTDPTTAADQVTCFSNSNATTDLFAPGSRTQSTGLFGGTSNFSGTSQASPLATACAALLLEADPSLTPDEIEAALESSTTAVTDATNGLGFPRLDCEEALNFALSPDCGDGIDNDGDGLTDNPEDPGCLSPFSLAEDPACDNDLDDDGDGLTDWDGGGAGPVDPECVGLPWRNTENPPKNCGLGAELAFGLLILARLRRGQRRG